jgi:hypothetical protein
VRCTDDSRELLTINSETVEKGMLEKGFSLNPLPFYLFVTKGRDFLVLEAFTLQLIIPILPCRELLPPLPPLR